MKEIINELKSKKSIYENLIQKTNQHLSQSADEGHLRVGRKKGKPQYFQITKKGDTNGRYLCQKDSNEKALTLRLAQRDYNLKLLKNCEAWKKAIDAFLSGIPEIEPSEILSNYPARRQLIKPAVLSNDEYIFKWQNSTYKGKAFDSIDEGLLTNRGERVRSKSEKIIADRLNFLGIPYRYEAPIKLNVNGHFKIFYPDFTILNPNTCKEIILEHFGMIDNDEYAVSMVRKFNLFILNGYVPGKDFIFTQETSDIALDTRVLDKLLAPLCRKLN